MNTTRFFKLCRLTLSERGFTDLISYLIIFALAVICNMFPFIAYFRPPIFLLILAIIGCIHIASYMAPMNKGNQDTASFLLLPTTAFEQLLKTFLFGCVGFFGISFLLLYFGDYVGRLLCTWMFNVEISSIFQQLEVTANSIMKIILTLFFFQSFCLLGSCFFRRPTVIKSLLIIIFVPLILTIFQGFLVFQYVKRFELVSPDIFFGNLVQTPIFEHLQTITNILLLIIIWLVTYFKIKEKEAKG